MTVTFRHASCVGALALSSAILAAQAPTPPTTALPFAGPARIKIDVDRTIGQIDPLLFGSFAEHLGRMIYGGIYEENSPLSDADGFRTDVMKAISDLGVSILRWPGGNFSSSYNWFDGIGPKDQRPARLDLAWNDLESNRFGTDEFLKYTDRIHAQPYVCVNLGLGTIDDARFWVEYTNSAKHTAWADRRRTNGHEAPYGVTYWALGNEIDGPWQMGHKSADDYAAFALEAANAMRAVDPSIKLIASGSSNYGADWIGWNRTVLQTLRNTADYIAIHTYINNRANDLERYLGESQLNVDRYISTTASLIKEVQTGPSPRPLFIAYDEWNVWYRTGNAQKLEEVYNFEDALAIGMFFNEFFRHADVVKMANLAQLVNVIAPIMTNKTGLFLQPIYFPFLEFGKQRGRTALDVFVSSPAYRIANRSQDLKYLDVSASYDATTHEVALNVLNRSRDRDIAATIDTGDRRVSAAVEVWQMNHSDLKATHTFGDDQRVRPVRRTEPAPPAGSPMSYSFPAHSLTILTMSVDHR
jgi:alpha-N-arabinofuranosidase